MLNQLVCVLLVLAPSVASLAASLPQQVTVSPEIAATWSGVESQLSPSALSKVKAAALDVAPSIVDGTLSEMNVTRAVTAHGLEGADIEVLVQIVMMQAMQSAVADLNQVLEEIRKLNSDRQALRDELGKLKADDGAGCPKSTAPASPFVKRQTPFLRVEYAQVLAEWRGEAAAAPDDATVRCRLAQILEVLDDEGRRANVEIQALLDAYAQSDRAAEAARRHMDHKEAKALGNIG